MKIESAKIVLEAFHRRLTIGCVAKFAIAGLLAFAPQGQAAAGACSQVFTGSNQPSSYNEVLAAMERAPYDEKNLPVIPIQMWKFIGKQMSFFVGKRSKEILNDTRDVRAEPMEKPIHPMGVGLVGVLRMHPSSWSGVFAGGEFPVLARASISQGNPYKTLPDGTPQKRSTALALKIFNTKDPNQKVKTANPVFQNDLNGKIGNDGKSALNYLESAQTNQPNLDFTKIRKSYEFLTLLGVAFGSFSTPSDRMAKFPYINPQIRPVHSMAELGVRHPSDVKTPTWIQIKPRLKESPVEHSDFRLEMTETLERDSQIVYDISVSDVRDDAGNIQWVPVGELVFNRAILSEGVDKNILFSHDKLNSDFTGEKFKIPEPSRQHRSVFDDIQ